MPAYFFDSSAATKLYVDERGSDWVTSLMEQAQPQGVFVVRITGVEVAAALFRRARSGSVSLTEASIAIADLRRDLELTYRVTELSPTVADLALTMAERHTLRGYDCVQLAAALIIHRHRIEEGLGPLELVSADTELNSAAQAEGLQVTDPNDHG